MHRDSWELRGRASLLVLTWTCLLATGHAAQAAVTISSAATQNMSCSGGVCEPTAAKAVLNAGDLETMLASGNTTITTTGSGVEANDIEDSAAFSWSTSNKLSLEAKRYITIKKTVSVKGMGNLSLSDDGGVASLSFPGGKVAFSNRSSALTINGTSYTLLKSISALASAIRSNPSGAFALAKSYNAMKDGTYAAPPITTTFTGTFEGLGNTISNLAISDASDTEVGFFAFINGGYIHDIGFENANVSSSAGTIILGVLAGYVQGAQATGTVYSGVVTGSYASGTVSVSASTYAQVGGLLGSACNFGSGYQPDAVIGSHSSVNISGGQNNFAGGLVGYSCGDGIIEDSYATGTVTAGDGSYAGGLAGASTAYVDESFATGAATTGNYDGSQPGPAAGGLVGYNFGVSSSPGTITNSYATGAATGGQNAGVGGLVGYSLDGTISDSYSTGAPSAGSGSYVGGFIGDDSSANLTDTYWDTDTSGITNLSQGAGNISNAPGITGLSTAQLQSGLPPGFAKKIWKEKSGVNGGLPYLAANPPPQ